MAFNKGISVFKILLNAMLTVWILGFTGFQEKSSIKLQKEQRQGTIKGKHTNKK